LLQINEPSFGNTDNMENVIQIIKWWQGGRVAEWQSGRVAGWQSGRVAEWQGGRVAGVADIDHLL
jgi:hypothetical protein